MAQVWCKVWGIAARWICYDTPIEVRRPGTQTAGERGSRLKETMKENHPAAKDPRAKRTARRIAREATTVRVMIELACRGRHGGEAKELCPDCTKLWEYVQERLARCPFRTDKPTCLKCTVHCHAPDRREQIREVMRYAGPRMAWRHPFLSLLHFLDGCRRPPCRQQRGQPGGSRRAPGGLLLAVLAGMLIGAGGFTFRYAEGLSYLSDDARACANCHIMNDQYDAWRKGPHHAVATCNDCHLPSQFVARYLAKARNGYHHSLGFTLQPAAPDEPGARRVFVEPIRIKPTNSMILQENCLRCHGDLVHGIVPGSTRADDAIRCVQCHQAVGHGARG